MSYSIAESTYTYLQLVNRDKKLFASLYKPILIDYQMVLPLNRQINTYNTAAVYKFPNCQFLQPMF